MSEISNRIRAYVNDPSVADQFGEWGALRPDQRRQIRELCDACDNYEKTANLAAMLGKKRHDLYEDMLKIELLSGVNIKHLQDLFAKGYTLSPPEPPTYTEMSDFAKVMDGMREGEWIERKVTMWTPGGKPYFRYEQECPCCGFINKSKKRWSSKYCPDCGAKMKGK